MMWWDTSCRGFQQGKGREAKSMASSGPVSWSGIAAEHSGAWRGCGETCWVQEGGMGRGASLSWQIACLCGSQCPYILFPLVPVSPRLVFHPYPSECNGVPGCLDGWRYGHYWQPLLERHSFLSRSPKTWVIAAHHTGEMCSFSGASFILPVAFVQFLSTPFSHFCPFLSSANP